MNPLKEKSALLGPTVLDKPTKPALTPAAAIDTNEHKISRRGMVILLLGFGGFLVWAAFAPLDEGVTANGNVTVTSNRQTIQHFTGGTVEKLLAKEGQGVSKEQALVELNNTQATAQLGITLSQFISTKAVEDRLRAERDGKISITFSTELEDLGDDSRVRQAKALQTQLFTSRRASLRSELGIFQENLRSLAEQLQGLQNLKTSREAQSKWLSEEMKGVRDLAGEGYLPKNRLYQLERDAAEINGALAETISDIGQVQNSISEVKLRSLARQQEYQKEVESELTDAQKETQTLAERLQALQYEVDHAVIRSPMDGIVVGLKIHTVGGVVPPGQPLMDIVPQNEPLIIEAMVDPSMSARVRPGMPVDIQFPALNQNTTPVIPGEVQTFSADRLVDQKTGNAYFLAQVRVTPEGMKRIGSEQIKPGMPAVVVIKAGERTMLEYLVKPMTDRMRLAFKEN